MPSTFIKILLLSGATLLLAGCTLVPAGSMSTVTKLDGGIWRSSDSGKTLSQANDVLATKGRVLSMNNADINGLAMDPQDPAALYAASVANGIFYSNDGGASWQQFATMKAGNIADIAVDYSDKCVVYATTQNKLFKTDDCGRGWNNVYYHQKSQVMLTAMALDPKASLAVYLGTSEGEILKSADGGHAWLTVYRAAGDKVLDIIVDPNDSKIVYAGTARKGLFKSTDAGRSWNSLGEGIKSYVGSQQYGKLIADPATPNALIYLSKFGMLRTVDGGGTWKVIDLLPASKSAGILAVAVNPQNSSEIYYVTASTSVKTTDGGAKWSSQQLPFNRLVTDIKINPITPGIIYLATKQAK